MDELRGRRAGATSGPTGTVHEIDAVHGGGGGRWEPVGAAFARNFSRRGDRGAAGRADHHGRKWWNLWAGSADFDRTPVDRGHRSDRPLRREGRRPRGACCCSTSRQLDLDAPVGALLGPSSRAAAKERVTVRQLLAHRRGVPAAGHAADPEQAVDAVSGPRGGGRAGAALPPGAAHGYHARRTAGCSRSGATRVRRPHHRPLHRRWRSSARWAWTLAGAAARARRTGWAGSATSPRPSRPRPVGCGPAPSSRCTTPTPTPAR